MLESDTYAGFSTVGASFFWPSILVPGGTRILLGGGVPKMGNYILVPRGTKIPLGGGVP